MRNPTLDVLRAVAVLLVFFRHSEGALLVGRFGWVGVDLFFVLSGFLVSRLLFGEYQKTRGIEVGRFLLRRGFKIYPQFYLLLAATLAGMILGGSAIRSRSAVAEMLFFQNYTPGLWDYTWSLAVEEHFYLLLTLGLAFMARRGGDNPFRTLPKWIAGFCVAILGTRILTWLVSSQGSYYVHVFPSHLRMDSLLVGVLLSYFSVFHGSEMAMYARRFGGWLPPLSMLLLAPVSFLLQTDPFIYTVGFSMISIAFGLMLVSALHPLRPRANMGVAGRAFARLGTVSYAFYLWHGPVLFLDDPFRARAAAHGILISTPVNMLLTFGLTLGIAFLTTILVEQPFLRLRNRWQPSRAKVVPEPLGRSEDLAVVGEYVAALPTAAATKYP